MQKVNQVEQEKSNKISTKERLLKPFEIALQNPAIMKSPFVSICFVGITDKEDNEKILTVEILINLNSDFERKQEYLKNVLDEEAYYPNKGAKLIAVYIVNFSSIEETIRKFHAEMLEVNQNG